MKIGERIKEERLKKGLKQEELAHLLNVSRSTVSSWEVGRNYPDLTTVVAISDLFGMTLDDLLREETEMLQTNNQSVTQIKKVGPQYQARKESVIYHMETSQALPTQRKYIIKNKDNQAIGTIKRKRYSFGMYDLPRLFLTIDGKKEISIIKDMEQFRNIYKIKGEDLRLEGKFLGNQFSILKKGEVIANVSVTEFEKNFTFDLNILDEAMTELLISFIFLIALVYEEESNVIQLEEKDKPKKPR